MFSLINIQDEPIFSRYGLSALFQLAYGVAFAFTLVEGDGVPQSQTDGCAGVVNDFIPINWKWFFVVTPLGTLGFSIIMYVLCEKLPPLFI